jgi:hypothetical protein
MMTGMGVFGLLMAGLVATQIMGLRMDQLARSKMGASEDARRAMSQLVTEIRSAGIVRIGNGDLTTFTEIGVNQLQQGDAIQIYPSKSDLSTFIRYYYDPETEMLQRTEDGETAAVVVARSVRNDGSPLFTSEDFAGNVLSNNFNNRVISLHMEFYQLQHPTVAIGPGSIYDFYQFRTKITRRSLE